LVSGEISKEPVADMTWADHLLDFYHNLQPPRRLPNNIEWLYPQQDPQVMKLVGKFLHKYYNDEKERRLMLGINPGRFGAGVTGVNFTAPKQLKEKCGIDHHLKMQTELSAEFVYAVIDEYGGVKKFYSRHFIGSVCPLGFIQNGKNINYYDDKELLKVVEPFIIKAIEKQLTFPVKKDECFCIGGEKNLKYLSALNEKYHFFQKIIPLPHPRFIMQYKRKQLKEYINLYVDALNN
jgi:hypothetical protein